MEQQVMSALSIGMDIVTTIFAVMLLSWFTVDRLAAGRLSGVRMSGEPGRNQVERTKRSLSGQVVVRRTHR